MSKDRVMDEIKERTTLQEAFRQLEYAQKDSRYINSRIIRVVKILMLK